MIALYRLLDNIKEQVRAYMRVVARPINRITGGRLSPNMVTLCGLFAHAPIAYLIATQHNVWAAILLVFFGLFDAFDGALATVQKSANSAGMLLDASTDRMKEVMLYTGAAYSLSSLNHPRLAAWAVAACGASLCVSYIKAKGETAVSDGKLSPNEVNKLFQDGLGRFEVRMCILVVGLVSDHLIVAIIVITVVSTFTAFERLIKISRRISSNV